MTTLAPTPSPTRTRVLVVDDHPGMADTLARAVSQLGPEIEAIPAMRGKQALDIVNESPVDILITDLMMPDMTGLQLIEALQAHPTGRPTYIILITAYDVPGLKETARRLKLHETVIKPFRPEKISQIVSRVLEEMGRSIPAQAASVARQPFKILIADDVPDNIALLARYLQNEGCTFVSAATGIEALEKAKSENPDLILLDINMPGMDGFEVLKRIRADQALAHLPVIFLTAARPDPVDVQTGLNLGADDYVIKPFDRRELMARIHTKLRVKESEDAIRRRNREMNI
ncbi:MAG: response regulator, partial [Chloroflexi bacterium]|nr:response regulator [Chloroflexota bacterium]